MRTKIRRMAAAAAGVLVMAACGGNPEPGRGRDGDDGEWLRVTVQNDGSIAGQVRVYLVPAGAAQEINLGSLSSLGEGTVEARVPEINGTYRLRAQSGTTVMFSPPVSLRGNEHVVWNMQRNTVTQAP